MDKENNEILSIVLLIFLPIILFFASFLIGRYPISPLDVINTILCPIFPQLEVSSTITTIVCWGCISYGRSGISKYL